MDNVVNYLFLARWPISALVSWAVIDSDKSLPSVRRQAITWINVNFIIWICYKKVIEINQKTICI